MKLRVLGCCGGGAPGMHTTSFLVDDRIAIDAGALTAKLSLPEQAEISHIFVSHSHIDHLISLPLLLDNVVSLREEPLLLLGSQSTLQCLQDHLFNGSIWPDFTTISNGKTTILRLEALETGIPVAAHAVEITPFPMKHSVECHGHMLKKENAAVAICSDTCSVEGLLALIPRFPELKAVILEASFPRRLAELATLTKHMSVDGFAGAVRALPPALDVLVTHLKPEFCDEVTEELRSLGLKNVSVLKEDKIYTF